MKITIQGRNKSNVLQRLQHIQGTFCEVEKKRPSRDLQKGQVSALKKKKVPTEQVTNIALWSNFLTLQVFFLTCCNFAVCSTTLWLVCCLKQTDSSNDALLLLCLHYCSSLIYSTIVHCNTWIYTKRQAKLPKIEAYSHLRGPYQNLHSALSP